MKELKENLNLLIKDFVKDTEIDRTNFVRGMSREDLSTIRKPTFQDFINWLDRK